jgi:hypothetical protein
MKAGARLFAHQEVCAVHPLVRSAARLAAALATVAAIPAAAQTIPTQIQLLDGIMRPTTRAGAIAPGRPLRALDSVGMPVANTTIRFSWSPICGPMPPFDVMTDSMGMAMTPPFATGIVSGTCTVSMQLLASMMTTMYMVEVYNTPDIVIMQAPGPMVDAVAGGMFQVGVTASVNGYALVNAPVSFTVSAPGDANVMMLSPMMTMTNMMGTAMASATANMMTGSYAIMAAVDGAMATFAVNQRAGGAMMPPPMPPGVTAQASGASPTGGGPVTVSLAAGSACTFGASNFVSVRDASIPAPAGIVLPHGLVSLRLDACGVGQSVIVWIDYPQDIPLTAAFWRYGPTTSDMTSHWYMVPATIQSHRLQLVLTDGASGDDDLMRNGSISVLGGFGVPGGMLQDLWWSAQAENGWGMSMIQHGDTLFTIVYAYDAAGRPTWYAMPGGQWNTSHTTYSGVLYQPRGSPFFQYDASRLAVGSALGTATITFADTNNAVLDYAIGGASGRKSITRQLYGAPDMMDHGNHADMWWGGSSQNGWGVALMQQYSSIFAVWFTYDAAGSPTWFVLPAGSWTSNDTYEGRAFRTTSSSWLGVAYDPSRLQTFDVGTMRLRFGGSTPALDYTLDGHSGTLSLSRQPF